MTQYSRENPSPRYTELLSLYKTMHKEGETRLGLPPAQTYPGISLLPQAQFIKQMIDRTKADSILDYGCGKGALYDVQKINIPGVGIQDNIVDYWDIVSVRCYDPCYEPYSNLPNEKFDGVISTDVLEHCPEQDVKWIIGEMFGYAQKFVFANVACYPAMKTLPNGENAHCTVQPPEWWEALFAEASRAHGNLLYDLRVETLGKKM